MNLLGKRVQRCRSLPSVALRSFLMVRESPKTRSNLCAKHCTAWVVAVRVYLYLWLETQWRRATMWSFLCQKTIQDVTFLLPTPPILVCGGCARWRPTQSF